MEIKITVDTNINLKSIDVDDIIQKELEKGIKDIQNGAEDRCPVRTGNLKDSLTTDIGNLEAEVYSTCHYASFVHDGTRFQASQPFLEIAGDSEIDNIADSIADAIERLF